MKRLLVLIVVAVVLFGASAGVSLYLRGGLDALLKKGADPADGHAEAPPDKASDKEKDAKGLPALPPAGAPADGGRPAVRPTISPDAENAVQLAANLRERLESIRQREQQLAARQKHLDLIYQDIRAERGSVDELRKQLNDEVKAAGEKTALLEGRAAELEMRKQEAVNQAKDVRKAMIEFDATEADRVKQMAAMYDSMAPENAAKIMQQLSDTGDTDTAVKVLAAMRERQAAKVLAEMPDPGVAAKMLDRLRGLRKPGTPPVKK